MQGVKKSRTHSAQQYIERYRHIYPLIHVFGLYNPQIVGNFTGIQSSLDV